MSPETQKRFISAFILILIVFACIYFGILSLTVMMSIFGILIIDEMFCNILDRNRKQVTYIFSQALFLIPYYLYNLSGVLEIPADLIMGFGLVINLFLIYYLFFIKITANIIGTVKKWIPILAGLLVLIPWLNISLLNRYSNWRYLLLVLLVVNFGMDSGAWFFGKLFGKHKLWEEVSPKKTIEGLLGGAMCSGILGTFVWYNVVGEGDLYLIILFSFLGVISQAGDLIQSKIKRQADIKDSSGLIPGHGGVYDRLDSLLFLSPFFVIMVNFLLPIK